MQQGSGHAFDPAKQTVFASAPITIHAVNGAVRVVEEGGHARIGHGQTYAGNSVSLNLGDPVNVEVFYGNINLIINAQRLLVRAAGNTPGGYSQAMIGRSFGDLGDIGHLSQNGTISLNASGSFRVETTAGSQNARAVTGSDGEGVGFDNYTTTPGTAIGRQLILSLSRNVVFCREWHSLRCLSIHGLMHP